MAESAEVVEPNGSDKYRRALWIVASINMAYGFVEMAAGFLAHSEALKADALDFFGDGVITGFALIAFSWRALWRARTAFAQGIFLGAMGVAVFAEAMYRAFVLNQPEPGLMGLYGGIALVINVTSALVLLPHRHGDVNVRAVWLFSRNDAIGNVLVVVAGGIVALTSSAWPDVITAAIIAGLFCHAAWHIVLDSRAALIGAAH